MTNPPGIDVAALLAGATGLGLLALLAVLFVASLRENEPLAASRILLAILVLPVPYFVVGLASFPGRDLAAWGLLALTAAGAAVLLVPTGRPRPPDNEIPNARIDERDTMFSREELAPGSPAFADYYRRNPEKQAADDRFRAEPGLLAEGAALFDPVLFPAADASFATVEKLRPFVDGPVAKKRVNLDPERVTAFLSGWAKKLGALSVGVTELREHHLYSVVGRGADYGKPVTLRHRYAIAFTVEMDRTMIAQAPFAPTVMESAERYLACGAIAVQMAEWIRRLGYPARAHIDGNYRVVCPLVARDAGLGEIGRMGLLMTPQVGPRVRIAVVTTDLPLVPSPRRADPTMFDFCLRCKKCAEACPSRAIPLEDPGVIDGVRRWRIDSEACFTFWNKIGTDCARCVSVCPYAHPTNPVHDAVRWGIRNSAVFRALAVHLDDALYGRAPAPRTPRGWLAEGIQAGKAEPPVRP